MPDYSEISGRHADIILNDFSGGRVNVPQVIDPAQLTDKQSPFMRNVDTAGKSIRKMKGFLKITGSPITGDVSSIYYDTFTGKIFVGYGTKLGAFSGNAITQLAGATGFTNNLIWSFCRVGSLIMAVNGFDAAQTWNDATATLAVVTTPPATWVGNTQPQFCTNWMGRSFAVLPNSDILYYSKLYDSTIWSAGTAATDGGALTIGKDGVPIKAIVPLANKFLIFKDPGLYLLTGSQDSSGNFDQTKFNWQQVSPEVDARSHRAVIAVRDAVFSWGRSFVWKITGTQAQQSIQSEPISDDIAYDVGQVILRADEITTAHYQQRHQIWFGVAANNGSTGIDTVHVYDYLNDQWMFRDGYSHKVMANVRDANGASQIYSGGYSPSGNIYQQNNTTDYDGAAMTCQWYSNWVPTIGAPKGRSSLAVITLGPNSLLPLTYTYAYDFNTSDYASIQLNPSLASSVWRSSGGLGSSVWNNTGGALGTYQTGMAVTSTNVLYGFGRRIQHRFYSSVIGADFAILEVKQPVTPVGYR